MTGFPKGFVWGTATASYQIEGATTEGGRGATIWDTFTDTLGKIKNGDTGDVACDHYHRYPQDVALMRTLNLNAYRFSIAWARILPQGRGAINQQGIDFYSRLVDELLANGITPYATLYHWDLPQALQDEGGWKRRGIVDDYVAYADVISRALGDRVKHWITLNEPFIYSTLGHLTGEHAPGIQDMPNVAFTVAHHSLLAHGRAVPVLRANVPQAVVGTTMYLQLLEPADDQPSSIAAAKRLDGYINRVFLDPLFKGQYPNDLEMWTHFAPPIQPDDLKEISVPIDFLGVNFYERRLVVEGEDNPVAKVGFVKTNNEHTDFGWEVYPEALYKMLRYVQDNYAPPAIYITESGACFLDEVSDDGQVHDVQRKAYLEGYFAQAARAIADGVPLHGYFVWSLLDNFEWAEGYSKRFGVVYVNYATQQRIIKDSGYYLADVAKATAEG
jgi:beta-glucosidase